MSAINWSEEHNEINCIDIMNKKTYDYGIWINDHVDYRVIMEISVDSYGHRYVDILEEILEIFNDDGDIVDSFNVSLPKKYRDEALEAGENYEF